MSKVNGIQVLDQYVLVKQTMTLKKRNIIVNNDEDKFNYSFEIVQIGDKCERNIKVGDKPVFEKHVNFEGIKMLKKDEQGMESLVIVHENSIIATDDEPMQEKEESKIQLS